MLCKWLSLAFLLGMDGMSLQAMEGLQPAKKANSCLRGLVFFYQKLSDGCKWPFKAIGSAVFQGAWDNARAKLPFSAPPPMLPQLGVPISPGQDEQLKEIVNSFFKALSAATNSKDKEAAGSQFMKNLFNNGAIAIGDLYNPDGEGRAALQKIVMTFREFITEDGVIRELIEEMRTLAIDEVKVLFERFEELNLDGGAAKRAVRAAARNVRGGVEDVGQAVNATSKKIIRNVLIGGVVLISSWFIWKHIDRTLRTPLLVLETSHKNYLQRLGSFLFGGAKKEMPPMILSFELKNRLNSVPRQLAPFMKKFKLVKRM